MNLIETINADFMTAYKAKEMEKKDFLGLVKSEAIKKTKTPSDDEVIAILRSMLKKHNESMDFSETPTLNKMELDILLGYLPTLYSEDKIREIVSGIIESVETPNMGMVMGMFQKNHKGMADNKVVGNVIEELL